MRALLSPPFLPIFAVTLDWNNPILWGGVALVAIFAAAKGIDAVWSLVDRARPKPPYEQRFATVEALAGEAKARREMEARISARLDQHLVTVEGSLGAVRQDIEASRNERREEMKEVNSGIRDINRLIIDINRELGKHDGHFEAAPHINGGKK